MLNFVILWEDRGFFRFFSFVKNAPFCHFVRCPCIFSRLKFCQKCSILSLCERTVDFYAYSILSKMLNFVILWEDRIMFRFFNFVKNAQFCHFQRGLWIFFTFQSLSKIVHFVICEKWTSNFNFVKNCPFCHLWKVDFKLWDKYKYTVCTLCVVIYQTILSKRINVVIIWEARIVFFSLFFNIVESGPFCHLLRGLCIVFAWAIWLLVLFTVCKFCQKWTSLSFLESGLQIMR